MKHNSLKFEDLANFLKDYTKDFGPAINKDKCEQRLAQLPSIPNTFIFVVNRKKNKIVWSKDIKGILGFEDTHNEVFSGLSLEQYFSLIHKNFLSLLFVCAKSVFQIADHLKHNFTDIEKSNFSFNAPVKNKKGEYILFRHVYAPFELDEHNNIISNICYCHLLGPYTSQTFERPSLYLDGHDLEHTHSLVGRYIMNNHLPYSDRQKLVLQQYAFLPDTNIPILAKFLNVNATTIQNINRKILETTSQHFAGEFKSAKEVAVYLKKLGWILPPDKAVMARTRRPTEKKLVC